MTRTNLVDAYSNRSVVAKLVNMEERISGAETSVEASAEAAASSASAAAASQTAAKTSETNAKASADTAAATLANTVDLSSKQTVTGAKTFAGDTTVTGSFVTSGNAEMAKLDIDTGKLTVGSGGSAEINGPLTATNTANVIKAANHDSVLTSNDVLTAKDINEVSGTANNLLHRSGNEVILGKKEFEHAVIPFYGVVNSFYPKKAIHKIFEIKEFETYINLVIQTSLGAEVRLVAYGHSGGATIKTCYATDTLDATLSIGVDENGYLGVYIYHPTSTRNWCVICSTHNRYSAPVEVNTVNVQVDALPTIVSSVTI